jgi:guanylate cyclase
MLESFWRSLLKRLARLSQTEGKIRSYNLQEQLIVGSSLLFLLAGLLWGLIYIAAGELQAGIIPITYSLLLAVVFGIFLKTRRTRFFLNSHHLLTLLLPFLLQLVLGGFVNSSLVVLWSFTAPLSALLMESPRIAVRWFIAFLLILGLGAALEPIVREPNSLSSMLILVMFLLNMSSVLGISFALILYTVFQKDQTFTLLEMEQKKSENLIHSMLPKETAERLKNDKSLVADAYPEASILFADIVGFTSLSTKMSPTEMVDLLNEVYTYLDILVDKYDLEKIRTIGDNYMVASGVPRPRSDHAQALAYMALDICHFAQAFPAYSGVKVQFRMGISSGPLIAGVVGRKNIQFDVWGDMVNIASRMETQGVPGKVQITKETYELIKDQFVCVPRGIIQVKGVGAMETYFLEGKKTPV